VSSNANVNVTRTYTDINGGTTTYIDPPSPLNLTQTLDALDTPYWDVQLNAGLQAGNEGKVTKQYQATGSVTYKIQGPATGSSYLINIYIRYGGHEDCYAESYYGSASSLAQTNLGSSGASKSANGYSSYAYAYDYRKHDHVGVTSTYVDSEGVCYLALPLASQGNALADQSSSCYAISSTKYALKIIKIERPEDGSFTQFLGYRDPALNSDTVQIGP